MDINSYLNLDRTLAIIKPHAFQHYPSILRQIHLAGFHVLQERCVKLTVEQAENFLKCQQQQSVKSNEEISMEIKEFTSGPLIALCLARENAVEGWIDLMGPEDCCVARVKAPTTLRALYGDDNGNIVQNAVHGSKCADDAIHELRLFFPNIIREFIRPDVHDIQDFISHNIIQPLTDAVYELLKVKPTEPIEWIAKYILNDNESNQLIIHPPCPETLNLIDEMKKNEIQSQIPAKKDKLDCGCSIISD